MDRRLGRVAARPSVTLRAGPPLGLLSFTLAWLGMACGEESKPSHSVAALLPFSVTSEKVLCDEVSCCDPGQPTVLGSNEDDRLAGGNSGGCLVALGGDDIAKAKSGDDVLLLGEGDDFGDGNSGDDQIHGHEGDDLLDGRSGDDELHGGSGNDVLRGRSGDDLMFGNQGDDSMDGSSGADVIVPGAGADSVLAGAHDDVIVIRAACELEPGEHLDGGAGFDSVQSPLGQAELEALGLSHTRIEAFEIRERNPSLPAGGCTRDQNGQIICECCDEEGYDPEKSCFGCLEGYHFDPATEEPTTVGDLPPALPPQPPSCVPNVDCTGVDCGPNGACDDSLGYPRCACDAPFVGESCDACPVGFEPFGNDCIGTERCGRELCNGHGSCELGVAGRLSCDCDVGFSGPNCGPSDLQIGAAPDSIEVDEELALYPSVANGLSCPSGFSWSVQSGPGSIQQNPSGTSATYVPEPLSPGSFVEAAVIRVTCNDDPSVYEQRAACVVNDGGLPVLGTCKQALIPVDNAMLAYLAATGMPGGTIAITRDENLVYLRAYGYRDQLLSEPMLTCTPMRVASITKGVVRAGIQKLVQDGETINGEAFSLNTRIMDHFRSALRISDGDPQPDCEPSCATVDFAHPQSAYEGFAPQLGSCLVLPPFETGSPDPRWWDMEVQDVMFHNSGIVSSNPGSSASDPYAHPNIPAPTTSLLRVANDLDLPAGPPGPPSSVDLLQWAAGACLLDWPGTQPQSVGGTLYSNAGYALLGRVMEAVSPDANDSWYDYLRGAVFQRAGDANPGWMLGDGMDVGNNPVIHEDLLFVGQILDTTPEEPYYFSNWSSDQAVGAMFKNDDGQWVRGGPVVTGGYAQIALLPTDAGSALVSSAEAMSKFFRAYNLVTGMPRLAGHPPSRVDGTAGPTLRASGYIPGSTAWFFHWDSRAHTVRTPQAGTPYASLPSQTVTPPAGVTASILFNQESPRGGDPNYPAYDPGTQTSQLLFDALTLAISQSPLGSDPWPDPLTEEEKAWGCDPYAPPPPVESCGDGVINDPDEECDGADLDGKQCSDFGPFTGGNLGCTAACKLDFTDCDNPNCGNGVIDAGEQCDAGEDVANNAISTGNPASAGRCSPQSCLWLPCADFEDGYEGCPCDELGPQSEGDVCPGQNPADGQDLICRFGPAHQGKRCMRCPYNGGDFGEGVGCPCGPGDACDRWAPPDGGPDALVCTKNEMACRASAAGVLSDQPQVGATSRCWDVPTVDPFDNPGGLCDPLSCLPGQQCIYGDCEYTACTDDDGIAGICRAMNMICDPDPYGDGSSYCINTNGCPVPGTNNGTSTCGPATTMNVINEPQGVSGDQWCPGPYRF